MSQHITKTKYYSIQMGVDRPCQEVFAAIFSKKGDAVFDFDPFSKFEPSLQGVEDAVLAVENYVKKKEPTWSVPTSMRDALMEDVGRLARGEDINYGKTHDSNAIENASRV